MQQDVQQVVTAAAAAVEEDARQRGGGGGEESGGADRVQARVHALFTSHDDYHHSHTAAVLRRPNSGAPVSEAMRRACAHSYMPDSAP